MDFSQVVADLRAQKLAGRLYEKEGHGKFRDCVTVRRDGALFFERYNYGEAAGLVCSLSAPGTGPDGAIAWNWNESAYSDKTEAPARLTEMTEAGGLRFDEKKVQWLPKENLKTMRGMGWLKMLFSK